eukprot:576898-Pelagomonas_calceolata.AAC.2
MDTICPCYKHLSALLTAAGRAHHSADRKLVLLRRFRHAIKVPITSTCSPTNARAFWLEARKPELAVVLLMPICGETTRTVPSGWLTASRRARHNVHVRWRRMLP